MFPLVHYFVNRQIFRSPPPLLVLGGFWPDLAFSAGINRDSAHAMGKEFYLWSLARAADSEDAKNLARGILSHGSEPPGVDYYADESWGDYRKGWCFMRGEEYMPRVADATGLPPDFIWWKSHNFVELSFELITHDNNPAISAGLMAALADDDAVSRAAALLGEYHDIAPEKIIGVYKNAPRTFAIETVTPQELARKQYEAFINRHHHTGGNIVAMAELLADMRRDLLPEYAPFMAIVIEKTAEMLRQIEGAPDSHACGD